MKIAIVTSLGIKNSKAISESISNYLKKENVLVEEFEIDTITESISSCDIVIALGGDGSMIRIAKKIAKYNLPLLGINCGHLGFMAGLESNELDKLSSLIDGTYSIEKRTMLEVSVERKNSIESFVALNDIVISRGLTPHILNISILDEEKEVISYSSDGVIIATPTGSTAYSLSAGGPIVYPTLDCEIITPVCPHTVAARPFVLNANTNLSVKVKLRNAEETFLLSVDGRDTLELDDTAKITISKCNLSAKFIYINKHSFYDSVVEKMINNVTK